MPFLRSGLLFASSTFTLGLLAHPLCATAQFVVDCSGQTPGAYTSISAVVPLLTNGSTVLVTGPCSENVALNGLSDLWIGAPWGQSAALQGNLTMNGISNLFLYGLNVSNPNGDGIVIGDSSNIQLDSISSSNNSGVGLSLHDAASVSVQNTGVFNNNGGYGFSVTTNSLLDLQGFGGSISISNNTGDGIYAERSVINGGGNLVITNNKSNPSSLSPNGFGIQFEGGARGVLIGIWQTNVISGNQAGGIELQENSEISLCCNILLPPGVTLSNIVSGNGPVGIAVGHGSQLTLFQGVQITNHSDAGIDVYGHSQVRLEDGNQISGNGTDLTDPTRAGLRVDGNSEAYIRQTQFSANGGPDILALVNSSADVSATTFSSNARTAIQCDSSSWLTVDASVGYGNGGGPMSCRTPNGFPPRAHGLSLPPVPNISFYRAAEAKYKQLMSALTSH